MYVKVKMVFAKNPFKNKQVACELYGQSGDRCFEIRQMYSFLSSLQPGEDAVEWVKDNASPLALSFEDLVQGLLHAGDDHGAEESKELGLNF